MAARKAAAVESTQQHARHVRSCLRYIHTHRYLEPRVTVHARPDLPYNRAGLQRVGESRICRVPPPPEGQLCNNAKSMLEWKQATTHTLSRDWLSITDRKKRKKKKGKEARDLACVQR